MRKILCLLVIAVLAAQICARPDDKDAAKKKDDAADAVKDKAKKAAEEAKAVDKEAEDGAKKVEEGAKKVDDEAEKAAKDCEEPVKDALKDKHHKKPHGPISTGAKIAQTVVDGFLSFWEGMPF